MPNQWELGVLSLQEMGAGLEGGPTKKVQKRRGNYLICLAVIKPSSLFVIGYLVLSFLTSVP